MNDCVGLMADKSFPSTLQLQATVLEYCIIAIFSDLYSNTIYITTAALIGQQSIENSVLKRDKGMAKSDLSAFSKRCLPASTP